MTNVCFVLNEVLSFVYFTYLYLFSYRGYGCEIYVMVDKTKLVRGTVWGRGIKTFSALLASWRPTTSVTRMFEQWENNTEMSKLPNVVLCQRKMGIVRIIHRGCFPSKWQYCHYGAHVTPKIVIMIVRLTLAPRSILYVLDCVDENEICRKTWRLVLAPRDSMTTISKRGHQYLHTWTGIMTSVSLWTRWCYANAEPPSEHLQPTGIVMEANTRDLQNK